MKQYKRTRHYFEKQYQRSKKIMDYTMGVIYVLVGTFVGIAPLVRITLHFPNEPFNYFFGALMCVYGVFRLYRAYR